MSDHETVGLAEVIEDLPQWEFDIPPQGLSIASAKSAMDDLTQEITNAIWDRAVREGAKTALEQIAEHTDLEAIVIEGECFMQVICMQDPCFHVRIPIEEVDHYLGQRDRGILAMKLRKIADDLDAEQEE